jgi:Protein of unknown function (DUF4031)
MAVLIDPPLWPAHGRRWSHLASDASLRELHEFAAAVGIPERGFEGDHYDVPEERYAATVAAGALPVSSRELLRRLQGSGLRRPKRRGERVLTSSHAPDGAGRVDAMLSALPPLGRVTGVHALVVAGHDLLVLPDGPDGVGFRLPAHALGPGDADEDAGASAQSLVVALVGGGAVPPLPAATQVGYLRRVGPGARVADPVVENEVVLRFVLGTPAPPPAGGAAWIAAREAVALLAGPVAALAAGAAYRLPGRPVGPMRG